jgi:serine/threonine protein kinase
MGKVRRISGDVTLPETPKGVALGDNRPQKLPSRYRIADVIGEGGMGRVFRAHDAKLGRDVAIKIIEIGLGGTDGSKQRERFAREARAAARLAHPNIVAVHDVDAEVGYLVMDLVDGKSLAELGQAPPPMVRSIAEQVLSALDAAHAAGVIHRDVKPSNVIVDASGKATLVDFGVARLVDAEMTRTGEAIGTPAYMAPEQLRGAAVDERTDLYGLGATLYEVVTGDRMVAFESPGEAAMAKLAASCPKDPALADVIAKCLRGEPAARYGSAREAIATLTATPKPRRSNKRVLIAIAAAIIGAVVAFLVLRPATRDRKLDDAFAIAQRGEHEKASLILEEHLKHHPGDADALTLKLLVHWWWHGVYDNKANAYLDKLEPEQRAMARGIELLTLRQEKQAIAYLEGVSNEFPQSPLIAFALGEARWHGGYIERGVAMLEQAYLLDPRWQMALHHVLEYRLSRGEPERLRAIHTALAQVDRSRAAALACEMSIAARKYTEAAETARLALVEVEPIPELYTCLAQAHALAGKLDLAEGAIRKMSELGALDLREWGGISMEHELLLYRGRYAEYSDKVKKSSSRQRDIVHMLWDREFKNQPPEHHPALHIAAASNTFGMQGPPLGTAMVLLSEHLKGRDPVAVHSEDPQEEIRAWGRALGAELRDDRAVAIKNLEKALAVPSKGDIRMLVAHALARNHHALGNAAAAREACRAVLEPTQYYGYRAVLVPDCVLWSGDRTQMKWLLEVWKGELSHHAIVEIRGLLGG